MIPNPKPSRKVAQILLKLFPYIFNVALHTFYNFFCSYTLLQRINMKNINDHKPQTPNPKPQTSRNVAQILLKFFQHIFNIALDTIPNIFCSYTLLQRINMKKINDPNPQTQTFAKGRSDIVEIFPTYFQLRTSKTFPNFLFIYFATL